MSKTKNLQTIIVDARGDQCPLPVMKTKTALGQMQSGDCLWLEAGDPLADIDIPNFCATSGHELVETEKRENYTRYLIKKGG